jgi:transcriptional/translational regulatory protein YebC/TACO1
MKEKYFVNIVNGGIAKEGMENDGSFAIYADESDLSRVEEKLENMNSANQGSYVRAHVPYFPEEESPENSRYDKNLKELYQVLYELGDEQTKEHIESINILNQPGDDLV